MSAASRYPVSFRLGLQSMAQWPRIGMHLFMSECGTSIDQVAQVAVRRGRASNMALGAGEAERMPGSAAQRASTTA